MCGIVGYWTRGGDGRRLAGTLEAANAALRHRGPDAGGTWFEDTDARLGMGHRRLAVIDLRATAAQPMATADGAYVIVYNGEIYNFAEIARELVARGHRLRTQSDTEVILESFRAWGPDCVDRFIGMFAFVIWDRERRRLSLCRDRIGVKPLYYHWDGDTLSFASELKALRELPHWTPAIDVTALGEFLQYGYIGQPRAIYQNVRKLTPGCWLHLEDGGEPRLDRYWSVSAVAREGTLDGDERELEKRLEALLVDAFRRRLVADVPVGLFLSGGVDSSLVAGLLKSAGVQLETFTIGFTSAEHDESAAAAAVARALGYINHREVIDERDAERVLEDWPDLYDEPFGDHSGIPTYLVSRMARQHVTVALSADGGDELFCGYAGYAEAASRLASHGAVPSGVRRLASRGVDIALAADPTRLAPELGAKVHRSLGGGLLLDRMHKLRNYLGAAAGLDALRPFRSFWHPGEIRRLVGMEYGDPRRASLTWEGLPIEQVAALDFHEFLPDDVLAKADRASMAVGLECREPLLDHRVVEMAFRLPLSMRAGPLGNKHALRSILYRHVPRELIDRPKQGFAVPIARWMDHLMASGAMAQANAASARKLGIDLKALDAAVSMFSTSPQGKSRLWLLYVLGRWADRWM